MRKLISLTLSVLMLFCILPVAVYADDDVVLVYTPVEDFYDNDELFAAYVDREFYPEYEISLWGVAGREKLTEKGKALYDFLKTHIMAVANGEKSNTDVEISSAMLQQWGITYRFTSVDSDYAMESVDNQLQSMDVITALLHDCPYDFYWFDKTKGWSHGAGTSTMGSSVTVTKYILAFSVAGEYAPANYDSAKPTVDTVKTSATATAVANANAIVEKYKTLNDYEKLVKYKEEICNLVSYNTTAAETPNYPYGDPWQMIYVFDNNTSTNVVCEGYSKAFQYLCDRSTFTDSDIACYTVSGVTQYNGSQGGHMWNIITMDDGKNYIVDITNSDSGAVGQNGGLFLGGMSKNQNTYYKKLGSQYIYYVYYDDTISFWGDDDDSILNIASSDYTVSVPTPPHVCAPQSNIWHSDADFHWQECSCGEDLNTDCHDNGIWRTTLEPQVGVYGQMELHCTVCDYLLGLEMIPPRQPDHTCAPKDDKYIGNSATHWQLCSCGEIINQAKHDGGTWVTVKEAEVGIEGKKELRCTVCGCVIKEETIPALKDETGNPPAKIIVGDINGSGKIDARDYLLLKRAYFGTYNLNCDLATADVNGNGKIDARDYLLLKRAYFGTYEIK